MHELGIDRLSVEARLRLIGEIWNTLSVSDMPIPASHKEELDQRLAEADANPGDRKPWQEVLNQLRSCTNPNLRDQ